MFGNGSKATDDQRIAAYRRWSAQQTAGREDFREPTLERVRCFMDVTAKGAGRSERPWYERQLLERIKELEDESLRQAAEQAVRPLQRRLDLHEHTQQELTRNLLESLNCTDARVALLDARLQREDERLRALELLDKKASRPVPAAIAERLDRVEAALAVMADLQRALAQLVGGEPAQE